MTVSSFVWSGNIPAGLALDSTITYYVSATDIHGYSSQFVNQNYRIVRFSRDNYTTTFPAYNFVDITTTGTQIPSTAFFPASSGTDDGTAGPFGIGGNFTFFGQTLTTAWVGANGALGLTATAAETVNVNAGGFFANWDIPQSGIAKNFVSPFWNDLYLGPGGHGAAYYHVSGTQFIVEYYRVGNFNSTTDTLTTFEVILDRSDNSALFQYANVGNTGLDSSNLTGIQGLPTSPPSGWVFLNRFGYPTQSRPAANFAVKLAYTPSGVTGKDKEVPAKFALHANYPNPFNPSTSVSYDIPTRSLVELTIYNLLGEKVADLVNGEQGPGSYSATWDGRNQRGETVASGMYIYRLKAGDFLQTRKMLLLK